jgi:ABC-type multidrug transport system permease subunit
MILRRRAIKQFLAWSVSPLMFLIAFGWGLGGQVRMEGMPYIYFLIPGLLSMGVMRQSFAIATEINVARFYWSIFEEFQAAPVSYLAIATGEVLAGVMRGLLGGLVVIGLAALFGVFIPIAGWLLVGIVLNAFIFASLAVVIAMVVKSHSDQNLVSNFVMTPMSFLAGTLFSLDHLPLWAKVATYAMPLTYSTQAIRAAATGQPVRAEWLLAMLGFAVAAFGLAVYSVRLARD